MNILKIINFKYFLLALLFGLLFMYLNDDRKKIIVYPTPSNLNNVEYKDVADNCFKYNLKEVKCPSNKSTIKNIPVQSFN